MEVLGTLFVLHMVALAVATAAAVTGCLATTPTMRALSILCLLGSFTSSFSVAGFHLAFIDHSLLAVIASILVGLVMAAALWKMRAFKGPPLLRGRNQNPDLHMTNHWYLRALALLLCCSAAACSAQSLFKCKQADGTYSYQGDPCPQSSTQQVLQADGRGNIKAARDPAASKVRNTVAASQPTQPEVRAPEKVTAAPVSDPSSIPPPEQGASASEAKRPTTLAQAFRTGRETLAVVFFVAGVCMCLVVWFWYVYTCGRFSDGIWNFVEDLIDAALGSRSDGVVIESTNRPDPVVLWRTLALAFSFIVFAGALAL